MILNIFLSVAVFLNLIMGLFVIVQDTKSINNRFFALMAFICALWTFTNFMTGLQPLPVWLEATYATGALVTGVSISWILLVINKRVQKILTSIIIIVAFLLAFASFQPGFIAKTYEHIYAGGVFTGLPGIGLIIYTVIFLLGAIYILIRLYIAQASTSNADFKSQLQAIFYGTLILVLISAFTSFIFPSLSIFSFSGLDSIGLLCYLLFIAYAITKHHLFNIKVIATEILIFTLWIFILIRAVLADTYQSTLIEIGLLVVAIIIGVLLIRSVKQEVEQRERIQVLAKQLSASNEALEAANSRLTELDKMKSEFVSLATHQIRGPLAAIKGYISLIMEGDFGPISAEVKEAVSVVFQSTNNLVTIVGDFLDVSRIEQGRMRYDFMDFDVQELTSQVVTEFKPNVLNRGLQIHYTYEQGKDYKVHADMGKIKQVIGNIIDNSIKYTPKGEINVALLKPSNFKIMIRISDTGVGIDAKVMPKLFQKFSRAANANEVNILGTGLGLYVAKQMIEAHKGKIWAESEGNGKGTQFYIELPVTTTS